MHALSDCCSTLHSTSHSFTTPAPSRRLCGGQLHHPSLRSHEEMGEGPSCAQLALTLTLTPTLHREVWLLLLVTFSKLSSTTRSGGERKAHYSTDFI